MLGKNRDFRLLPTLPSPRLGLDSPGGRVFSKARRNHPPVSGGSDAVAAGEGRFRSQLHEC